MKHLKKYNEDLDDDAQDDNEEEGGLTEKTLQQSMDDFYDEYESSYIDANTHGVIVKLIEHLQKDNLIDKGEFFK